MNVPKLASALVNPRNIWSRLRHAADALDQGDLAQARDIIEGLRYHPDLAPDMLAIWQSNLETAVVLRGAPAPLSTPAEYLANAHGLFRLPFRQLNVDRVVPKPYPWAMALPAFAGAGNQTTFLEHAATALEARLSALPFRMEVTWTPVPGTPPDQNAVLLQQLITTLAAQAPVLPCGLTLPADCSDLTAPFPLRKLPEGGVAALSRYLEQGLDGADMVLFLSGSVQLDPLALARAARLIKLSDRIVVPLVPLSAGSQNQGGLITPFTPETPRSFTSRYPFREMAGLNMAISARFLRRLGGLEGRFSDVTLAARELGYRAWVQGAWFVPLRVPELDVSGPPAPAAEVELYKALCPNHWDRKRDVPHEVAKVSVYIPAYNASKYIERAVDSVLAQDVADLDVCIANDGSRDGTLALLEQRYGQEPRVRWLDNPNGGIGFASNSAIRMSRSIYIGQLDSDDCLKPGAVRRLMEVLDENPSVVCAYGSCERIDAAGNYTQDEYSWPVFSREKMMITSIAHHFRMFRRQTWERTTGFREDIVNGVDYDIFLKMSELGEFRHVDEKLYQRRWHGENTSHVNEHHQTANTYRVQREALARQGLARYWDVHVPDQDKPRNVTYQRRAGLPMVVFWPDYSNGNPYQRLLYAKAAERAEIVAGDIDAALRVLSSGAAQPGTVIFHLHWLNALFRRIKTHDEAQQVADNFMDKLVRFRAAGGQLLWTIHNHLTHDAPFPEIESALSARLAQLADKIHLHCAGSSAEVADVFTLPQDKVCVSRHGHYIGAYSDIMSRDQARTLLGISPEEDVILFTGMIRPYKGVKDLITAFRSILAARPQARLVLAGLEWIDPLAGHDLTDTEGARILRAGRFLAEDEMQVFLRAADMAVYPYQKILTSGSLLLALSFGVPTIVPHSAMTAEILKGQDAGLLYDPAGGADALESALQALLAKKDSGHLQQMAERAYRRAASLDWPDFAEIVMQMTTGVTPDAERG